jgi:hypothetical protein
MVKENTARDHAAMRRISNGSTVTSRLHPQRIVFANVRQTQRLGRFRSEADTRSSRVGQTPDANQSERAGGKRGETRHDQRAWRKGPGYFDIIEPTDGVPLFVEEMTKAVLEAENENAVERTIAAAPSPSANVPASLHASLMARLDRLGPVKTVAQIGAVIRREFSHALLREVASEPEALLSAALDRLVAAGLLFRQGVPPHATYLFNHALVQQAAYQSLLKSRRHLHHARIAEALEGQFSTAVEPEVIAYHFTQAGRIEQATDHWLKAGQRAMQRSANIEAERHRGRVSTSSLASQKRPDATSVKSPCKTRSAFFHPSSSSQRIGTARYLTSPPLTSSLSSLLLQSARWCDVSLKSMAIRIFPVIRQTTRWSMQGSLGRQRPIPWLTAHRAR